MTTERPISQGVRRLRGFAARPELLFVVVLIVVIAALPNGLPVGIAGIGVVAGALLGLHAMGIALLYSRTKVLSFAQFGLGISAAVLFYLCVLYNQWAVLANGACHCLAPHGFSMSQLQHHPDPFRLYLDHHHPWALAVNALISAVLGVMLATWTGRQVHKTIQGVFLRAPRIVPTLATLAMALALAGGANGTLTARTASWWGWRPFSWWPWGPRPGTGIHGRPAVPEGVFAAPGHTTLGFTLGGNGAHFHLYDVLVVASALAALGAVVWRFRLGRRGLLSRATADNLERAATLGVDVVKETLDPWRIAGFMSGLAGVLGVCLTSFAPVTTLDMNALTLVLAAVVLARMTSPPFALLASVLLGVLQQAMFWSFHSQVQFQASLVAIIGVALVLQRRRTSRAEREAEAAFTTAPEPAKVPRELAGAPGVRGLLRGTTAVVTIAFLAYPLVTSPRQLSFGITSIAITVVGLSVLVLSGWGGLVSLGQMGFGAVGGFIATIAGVSWHLPLPVALLLGAAAAAVIAPIVGLPALRLPGPFVVIVTLAFSLAVPALLLDPSLLGRWLPANLPRPVLLGLDLSSDRYFYWLSALVLIVALAVVIGLRRSRLRRALIAARDNPHSAASFGVDISRLQLEAFAVAGAIAGLGGGLLAYADGSVQPDTFSAASSTGVFLVVVIGGISAVSGPVLGAVAYNLFSLLGAVWVGALNGLGTLIVLMIRPGGIASIVVGLRDAAVRVLMHLQGVDLLRLSRTGDGTRIAIADRGAQAAVVPVRYRLVGDGYGPVEGTKLRPVEGVTAATAATASTNAEAAVAKDVDDALAAISCHRLDVAYGGVEAVTGVSLAVAPGEVLAVVGLNGAGKTSLLRALAGLEPAAHGTVELFGSDVTLYFPQVRAALGVAFVPGGAGVLPTLTVRENLAVSDPTLASLDDICTRFPALAARLDADGGALSGGEQQMLAIAQALVRRPTVLLVDELSLGLSPDALAAVLDAVRELAQQGTAVVLVEQSISAAISLADNALFLDSGRVRYQGPASALRDHPELFASIAFGAAGGGAGVGVGSELARLRQQQRVDRDIVLRVDGVTASYGAVKVVDDVSFDLAAGEVLGVIGPNGAGKTSLFDCLSGLLPAAAGSIELAGQDITTLSPHKRAKLGLMRSFQSVRLFPSLSVRDCIAVALETRLQVKSSVYAGLWLPPARNEERRVDDRVDALLELLHLEKVADAQVGSLSLGSRRMVDLACQLAARPKVLLLDEPAAGLAQSETELLGPLVSRISSDLDCAVVIIEHNIQVLASVAPRLIALDAGAVIAEGPSADVLADDAVTAAYFGTRKPELVTASS
ncbi:MAG TPA: ATP-binding cassette domain-containing protein [Mycobacteriales bacterium]|nr:ATP-binding cassette domain-containing protein [Mycobacteriales bacterium]